MNVCENHALPSSKAPFASVVFLKGGCEKKKYCQQPCRPWTLKVVAELLLLSFSTSPTMIIRIKIANVMCGEEFRQKKWIKLCALNAVSIWAAEGKGDWGKAEMDTRRLQSAPVNSSPFILVFWWSPLPSSAPSLFNLRVVCMLLCCCWFRF